MKHILSSFDLGFMGLTKHSEYDANKCMDVPTTVLCGKEDVPRSDTVVINWCDHFPQYSLTTSTCQMCAFELGKLHQIHTDMND